MHLLVRLFAVATLATASAAHAEPIEARHDEALAAARERRAAPPPPPRHPTAYYVGSGMMIASAGTFTAALLIMLSGTGYYFTRPQHLGPGAVATGVSLGVASPFLLAGGAQVLPSTPGPAAAAWIENGGGGGSLRVIF